MRLSNWLWWTILASSLCLFKLSVVVIHEPAIFGENNYLFDII